jgi:phospholipid/cholesterol/gamma-HCH transport system permease protein
MVLKSESTSASFILEDNTLKLGGKLSLGEVNQLIYNLENILRNYKGEQLLINLDELDYVDSAGITAIYYLNDKYSLHGITVKIEGGSDNIRRKLDLFKLGKTNKTQLDSKPGLFERLGTIAIFLFNEYLLGFFQLAADITYWSVADLFRKPMRRKGEFVNQALLIGVNAVLIVGAMSFIIGFVLALQSAAQLRSFGANIYIVDLTVIAMMCEMGPLITAIMVAGRSGSSIAAEIATMKVTSETDALRTMGLNPVRFVIVPKMYGSILTMPFLTIIADILGIAGGLVIAVVYLDISPVVFVHRMQESLYMKDIIFGVIKSIVFAYLIVITGSYFGFRVKQGAEGVGKVTTIAVVVSISLVIIADSIMGLIFY